MIGRGIQVYTKNSRDREMLINIKIKLQLKFYVV